MSIVSGCFVKKCWKVFPEQNPSKDEIVFLALCFNLAVQDDRTGLSSDSDHPVKRLASARWSSQWESLSNTLDAKHHVCSFSLIKLSLGLCISCVCVCACPHIYYLVFQIGVLAASPACNVLCVPMTIHEMQTICFRKLPRARALPQAQVLTERHHSLESSWEASGFDKLPNMQRVPGLWAERHLFEGCKKGTQNVCAHTIKGSGFSPDWCTRKLYPQMSSYIGALRELFRPI